MQHFSQAVSLREILKTSAEILESQDDLDKPLFVENAGSPALEFCFKGQSLPVAVLLKTKDGTTPFLVLAENFRSMDVIWGLTLHDSIHTSHPAWGVFNKHLEGVAFFMGVLQQQPTDY